MRRTGERTVVLYSITYFLITKSVPDPLLALTTSWLAVSHLFLVNSYVLLKHSYDLFSGCCFTQPWKNPLHTILVGMRIHISHSISHQHDMIAMLVRRAGC